MSGLASGASLWRRTFRMFAVCAAVTGFERLLRGDEVGLGDAAVDQVFDESFAPA